MKNKLTAVEWLESKFLIANGKLTFTEFKQAKQKEKEQMFNSFMAFESNTEENEKLFDEYYNETYGGNK